MLNVIFFGSSEYCVPVLASLQKHFNLCLIVTKPDKPVGRTKNLQATAVKQWATKHSIPVISPASLKDTAVQDTIASVHPTISVVADYGLIIPKNIYTIPAYQTLNIHFGRLPRFRGPSPVQYSILYGEKSAWITFMQIDTGLDTGPIVYEKEFPLSSFTTTDVLYTHLFKEAAILLPDIIPGYIEGKYQISHQPSAISGQQLTPTAHIQKNDAYIPWELLTAVLQQKKPAKETITQLSPLLQNVVAFFNKEYKENTNKASILYTPYSILIERAVRAFTPWPIVWTTISTKLKDQRSKLVKKRLKILKSHLGPYDTLHIDRVQLEGKKDVPWKQFLQGYPQIAENI